VERVPSTFPGMRLNSQESRAAELSCEFNLMPGTSLGKVRRQSRGVAAILPPPSNHPPPLKTPYNSSNEAVFPAAPGKWAKNPSPKADWRFRSVLDRREPASVAQKLAAFEAVCAVNTNNH